METFESRSSWLIRSLVRRGWEWRRKTCCGKPSIRLGAIYRAAHDDVHESDERRCLLERHLQQRWRAGEHDPEELTCAGLAFLERILSEVELDD